MKQNIATVAIGLALIISSAPRGHAQTNLFGNYNPGFETNFTGWGGSGFTNCAIDTVNPGEGAQSARHNACLSNTWNVLVNTAATIPTVPGRDYQLSVMTRETLVGGNALIGLCEENASQIPTQYLFKTVTSSTNWHAEYETLTPATNTAYLRIYLQVDQNATAGSAWWDDCRLIAVSTNALASSTTSAFSTDVNNRTIDIAPLPVSTFTNSGTSIVPRSLIQSVNIGTPMVGGTLSWKVVKEAAGPSGTAIIDGSGTMSQVGLWAWTVDLDSAVSSLTSGNYLLVISATSEDQTISRNASRLFTIQ